MAVSWPIQSYIDYEKGLSIGQVLKFRKAGMGNTMFLRHRRLQNRWAGKTCNGRKEQLRLCIITMGEKQTLYAISKLWLAIRSRYQAME